MNRNGTYHVDRSQMPNRPHRSLPGSRVCNARGAARTGAVLLLPCQARLRSPRMILYDGPDGVNCDFLNIGGGVRWVSSRASG